MSDLPYLVDIALPLINVFAKQMFCYLHSVHHPMVLSNNGPNILVKDCIFFVDSGNHDVERCQFVGNWVLKCVRKKTKRYE